MTRRVVLRHLEGADVPALVRTAGLQAAADPRLVLH